MFRFIELTFQLSNVKSKASEERIMKFDGLIKLTMKLLWFYWIVKSWEPSSPCRKCFFPRKVGEVVHLIKNLILQELQKLITLWNTCRVINFSLPGLSYLCDVSASPFESWRWRFCEKEDVISVNVILDKKGCSKITSSFRWGKGQEIRML